MFEQLEKRSMMAVSSGLLNSWQLAGQGQFAQAISGYNVAAGPSTTWPTNVPNGATYNGGNATPTLGDITKVSVSENYVYVNTADFASYVMGPWFNANGGTFINFPTNINALYRIREATTYPSATRSNTGNGAVGVAVNGTSIFNNGDANTYNNATGADANPGSGIWHRQAYFSERVTFDHALAHQPGQGQSHYHVNAPALRAQLGDNINYVGTTNYFPYDPQVLLTSGQGQDGKYAEKTANLKHSPIIGWAFDGRPIYGPYGYSNASDANSGIRRMETGFQLRNITDRTTYPGWAAQIAPISQNVAPNAVVTLAATQYGPAVNAQNPLGKYGEDYEFVPGRDLDQYNGRFAVTPEFPQGVYAYFITIDAVGTPVFPYLIGRQYEGPINSGRVNNTNGDGPVTVVFDVATNTAPTVISPNAFSVPNGGTYLFSAGSPVSLSDVDAATVESITLTVTAGTLNVNLSGALASGASITAGANSSTTMTLSGGLSQINAALQTLTYNAPSTGTSATMTVQANDGSAVNNLSLLLTTNITLISTSIQEVFLFYKGSQFHTDLGVAGAVDPIDDGIGNANGKDLLKSGASTQSSSIVNVSNYSKGINGLVLDVNNLASNSLTAGDFVFRRPAPGTLVTGLVNPSTWTGTVPSPTITVAPGTPSRVQLEWADNAIENTWLQVIVKANANTGLTSPVVYYIGHAAGEISGVDPYRVGTPEISAVTAASSSAIVGISETRDIDKSRRVGTTDLSFLEARSSSTVLLRNIIIPIAGSAEELGSFPPGFFASLLVAPSENDRVKTSDAAQIVYAPNNSLAVPVNLSTSTVGTTAGSKAKNWVLDTAFKHYEERGYIRRRNRIDTPIPAASNDSVDGFFAGLEGKKLRPGLKRASK